MKNKKYLKMVCNQLISCKKRYLLDREISDNWRKVNATLYQICKCFPDHYYIGHILTKVTAVDRLYNAWLYRKGVRYIDVARKLQASDIDDQLNKLGSRLSSSNIEDVVDIASTVAGLGNIKNPRYIVFASKYLHFHQPNVFPILDNYAEKKLRSISNKLELHFNVCNCNSQYECFCRQILSLRVALKTVTNERFSLMDFDKLLYGMRYLLI